MLISDTSLYDRGLKLVLRWEGGYSNHPNDPGGETNFGITHKVYDKWRRAQGLPKRSVKLIDKSEVSEIYETLYWERSRCPDFKAYNVLAIVHFDTAVNMGRVRAAKTLQEAVGANADGQIGPKTLAAVDLACRPAALPVMAGYCDIRERVYRWIAANRDGADVFLKGWMNRLNALRAEAGILSFEEIGLSAGPGDAVMRRLADLDFKDPLEGIG